MLMNYRSTSRKQRKESKPPTLWQFTGEIYKMLGLIFEIIVSFPLYILGKLGITNIIPTLLSVNSIVGPGMIAVSVASISCSVGIGLGVGLGVGLTCAKDADLKRLHIPVQFQDMMNDINVFTDSDECIEFILSINDNKICLIISQSLEQHIVPCVHDISQLDSILIFCDKKKHREGLVQQWSKIKGVFKDMMSICEVVKKITHQCEQNSIPISFVTPGKKLNQLDPTFIKDRHISYLYAESNASNLDLVGIVFVMKVNPNQSTIPFASIHGISYFPDEDEVLFSMHSVFRIHDITLVDESNRIHEINLSLTSDSDAELNTITNHIREESSPHNEGWSRLCFLLTEMHQNDQAEKICHILLDQTTNESSKAWINIDEDSKDYQNTITLLQRIINDVYRKACMIISGALGQHIVPQIHDMSQIDSIFIFCGNRTHHEGWAKKWGKIKGVFTEITSICRALEETAKKCEENYVSMSFVPIDPSQSTIPFASVRGISYYPKENEILFSMHSVFRVNDIKSLNGTNRLYEVNLSLTSDNDKDLCILTNYIREASFPDTEGWYRLGLVLNDMNQHGKAEEIYSMLLEQTTNKNEKAIAHQPDMSTMVKKKTSKHVSNNSPLKNLHIDQNFITSKQLNGPTSNDKESVSIPSDKLHRRNPLTVRQEIQPFDDLVAETTLADLQLSEMPGLQNTEQWKRIAARSGQKSPPLSRRYYQKAASTVESENGHIPYVLGSYRRPGRVENEQDTSVITSSKLKTRRRRIIIGLSITAIIVMIVVAIVIAVILVRKPKESTTDYYTGYILVRSRFDPVLLSSSSTLAKNYQREFCTLVSTTLSDRKTKYAIFYSACVVFNYRNGSIIGDFTLGFTRYQNVTRLNAFLNRTIINKQLFGGTILSIVFNSTTDIGSGGTDYDGDYEDPNSVKFMKLN
ncbi:hypothetical protein I4U23_025716 [Adineta vaga]|nr:hypothetical protein I4U23_025716 [Adineta vaga]